MKKERNDVIRNSGFSLVELIIVIAIMAILTSVIAPNLIKYIDKANKTSDVQTASVIGQAAERRMILDEVARNSWNNCIKGSRLIFNVTDEQGNTYKVDNVCDIRNDYNHSQIRNGKNEGTDFTNALIDELGSATVHINYTKSQGGINSGECML